MKMKSTSNSLSLVALNNLQIVSFSWISCPFHINSFALLVWDDLDPSFFIHWLKISQKFKSHVKGGAFEKALMCCYDLYRSDYHVTIKVYGIAIKWMTIPSDDITNAIRVMTMPSHHVNQACKSTFISCNVMNLWHRDGLQNLYFPGIFTLIFAPAHSLTA